MAPGFWRKVRATLGKVPFTEDVVAAWYCVRDPATPGHVRAVLLGAIVYFVVPTDMIPDFFAGLGFTDDAAVLAAALSTIGRHLTAAHRDQARRVLATDAKEQDVA